MYKANIQAYINFAKYKIAIQAFLLKNNYYIYAENLTK